MMSAKLFSDEENKRIDDKAAPSLGGVINYGTTPNMSTVIDPRHVNGDMCSTIESDQAVLVVDLPDDPDKQMALFEDESQQRPFVSNIISRLANYEGGIVPQIDDEDDDGKGGKKKKKKSPPKSTKLSMMMGVFFPCIQNIFGIILFIRYAWVIGTAGWLEALVIVILCCLCVGILY